MEPNQNMYVEVVQPDGLSQVGKTQDIKRGYDFYDSIVIWVWNTDQIVPATAFGQRQGKPFEIRTIGPAGVDQYGWNASEPKKLHVVYHYSYSS